MIQKVFKIAALVVFVLALFGVEFCNMLALGLALYVASEVV